MTLMSVRVGTNDLAKARSFYDATFGALGVGPDNAPPEYGIAMYAMSNGVRYMIGSTRDGAPACHANGGTIGFVAPSQDAVDAWHAAGLANGGKDEGAPGPRERARGAYGAYLRDPDGNKLAAYHALQMG